LPVAIQVSKYYGLDVREIRADLGDIQGDAKQEGT
jgi:hypothetical protein